MSLPLFQSPDKTIMLLQSAWKALLDPLLKGGSSNGVPSGSVFAFAGAKAPAGYLLCDGSSYLCVSYPALYAAIAMANGGNGTYFNVPDYRGRFLRGVTGSSANDPDASSRTAMNSGGNTGNNVGSVQSDQFRSHTHVFNNLLPEVGFWFGAGSVASGSEVHPGTTSNANQNSGGNETRPVNAYVNFIIKT